MVLLESGSYFSCSSFSSFLVMGVSSGCFNRCLQYPMCLMACASLGDHSYLPALAGLLLRSPFVHIPKISKSSFSYCDMILCISVCPFCTRPISFRARSKIFCLLNFSSTKFKYFSITAIFFVSSLRITGSSIVPVVPKKLSKSMSKIKPR